MNAQEREFVVSELRTSEARVLALLDGLTATQWTFRERPERWSIAEILEHLVLFERFIRGAVLKMLESDAEAEKATAVAAKLPAVLRIATSRESRIETRDVVRPSGRWPDTSAMISMLQRERAKTIALAETTQADLENHFFAHLSLGDLNAYQWLVLIAKHSERHALQIEEIKSDAQYPR
jgi:hypothetical protein